MCWPFCTHHEELLLTTEAQCYPLHMRVKVYRTRAITSLVNGRNAENEPVSCIKMADYRCARKYGNALLYIAIFETKRLYKKRQIDSGASMILSLAPWRLHPTVHSITHTSRAQPLLALLLGFIFSAIVKQLLNGSR